MSIKEQIQNKINLAVKELYGHEVKCAIEFPTDMRMGDYASNIAFVLANKANEKPIDIADKLQKHISLDLPDDVASCERAGAGFLNFKLSDEFLIKLVGKILKNQESYGHNKLLKGKKVIIEYTDPNPFKVFHIGHLMTNVIGEALSRLFEASGADVKRVTYQGDVGLHVARALWGMQALKARMPSESASLNEKAKFLGSAYSKGALADTQDTKAHAEIVELNKKIYANSADIKENYDKGKKWSLEHFEDIYKILGSTFDEYIFESQTWQAGMDMVLQNIDNGIFKKSEGAIIYNGEDKGLHTRVFITGTSMPLYEAKELALSKIKYDSYKYDLSFIITAEEQREYFKVVQSALTEISPDLAKKTQVITHGMMRLPSGKMSSREGNIISGAELIQESIKLSLEKMRSNDIDPISADEQSSIAQKVGVGALKYSILRQSIGKDIVYDEQKSFSFDGDSGPYLQYTYARTQSILNKAKQINAEYDAIAVTDTHRELERLLHRFGETIERAVEERAPHYVVTYLTQLAGAFNAYYANTTIIDLKDVNSPYRVLLASAVGVVLKTGLTILGIEAPSKM